MPETKNGDVIDAMASPAEKILALVLKIESPRNLSSVPEDLNDSMKKALDMIPKSQARILRMHFYEGMSYQAIGEQDGVTRSYVQATASRGIQSLRKPETLGLITRGSNQEKQMAAARTAWHEKNRKEQIELDRQLAAALRKQSAFEKKSALMRMQARIEKELKRLSKESETPLEHTNMDRGMTDVLKYNGIHTVEKLCSIPESTVTKLPGMTSFGMLHIKQFLSEHCLCFHSEDDMRGGCTAIADYGLSNRTVNMLRRNGIITIDDLRAKTMEEMCHIRGIGKASIEELNRFISENNIKLHPDQDMPDYAQVIRGKYAIRKNMG